LIRTVKFYVLLLITICTGAVVGCSEGKRPFVLGSVCLRDAQGLAEFRDVLQSIAVSEHSEFIDTSRRANEELKAIGKSRSPSGAPAVNMGIELKGGGVMMASNLGLPGYQVGVGFSEGSNARKAHEFAARALAKIQAKWDVAFVQDPAKSGIRPSADCPPVDRN
jgi:hypothetical protein